MSNKTIPFKKRAILNDKDSNKQGCTDSDHFPLEERNRIVFTFKKIVFTVFTLYALFGTTAAVISSGMKGSNGPFLAAIFILTLLALNIGLIKCRFRLSEVNRINMIAIMSFYFFSITLPLCITCPSPLSPVVAFAGFSLVTFLPFTLISYLIKRTLISISSPHNS